MQSVAAIDNFRRNLRRICQANHVSQRELAKRVGMSYPHVNRILQGENEPGIKTCEDLAKAVGWSLQALIAENVEIS